MVCVSGNCGKWYYLQSYMQHSLHCVDVFAMSLYHLTLLCAPVVVGNKRCTAMSTVETLPLLVYILTKVQYYV